MINVNNLDIDILVDEKSDENVLIYDSAYKVHCGIKPLCITLDKVDEYIRKHDKTRYLELFHSNGKYDKIFDRIGYLTMLNSNIQTFILINI